MDYDQEHLRILEEIHDNIATVPETYNHYHPLTQIKTSRRQALEQLVENEDLELAGPIKKRVAYCLMTSQGKQNLERFLETKIVSNYAL